MGQKDKLRIKEVMRRALDPDADIVCYLVVSGRGKSLLEHAQVREIGFAARLVDSVHAFDRITAAIKVFDNSVADSEKAKMAAMAALIREVRKATLASGRLSKASRA